MEYTLWRTTEVNRLYEQCLNVYPQYIMPMWLRQEILLAPNPNLFPSIEIFIEAQREVHNRCIWFNRYIDLYNLEEVKREYQELLADEIMERLEPEILD